VPELPDVERFKRYLDSTALHQEVARVDVVDADMLENVSKRRLRGQIKGRTFESTSRHGKFLFVNLGEPPQLVLHFGMTGFLDYAQSDRDAPDHTRVSFRFSGGGRLAYVCQRKLGLVTLTDDPAALIEEHGLGPDALDDKLTAERFCELLSGRRGTIKPALMNQGILAGVGNVYADEILFQTRIDPARKIDELDEKTLKEIYRTMRRVLRTSVRNNAEIARLPGNYLLPHREGDGQCPHCGGRLKQKRVSGRGSWFCENCQG